MRSSILRFCLKMLPILLALLLFVASIIMITHELKAHSLQSIWQYLSTISKSHKIAAIALTGFGYLVMTGYDLLGFRYINQSLAPAKIALTAFISYAVGNTIGFTAFSGTAIRYRFYGTWGVSKLKIAQLIIFTHLTFWLGLFAVSGVVFLVDPLSLPAILHLPFESAHPIGIIFLIFVSIYFLISVFGKGSLKIGSELIKFPTPKISLASISVAALDWGLASAVLYLLLPVGHGLSFSGFFGIYILGLTAGLISSVPGGLGVFETVILLLIPATVSNADVLGALIAYRAIYYFLPLIVALILFMVREIQQHRIT
ncbi:hypothetical protein [Crocosphaera sp. XPORK-15E]|uniref:hypothetical protein n=1 Tax=Crocosphaera sp. XPORK-15E TaxID=3110247 RepID=UPI002B1FC0F7|nr:hypothetical protein [Crocosphaera sp. XPORK-15E]MEA5536329.1 hypothetical protein [Crocosphaera sp. XPORK-15E]